MSEGNRIHDIIGELLCNDGIAAMLGETLYNWLWCLTLLGSFLGGTGAHVFVPLLFLPVPLVT
jgi:hypothetical protein